MRLERLLAPLRGPEIPADLPPADPMAWALNHESILRWMFNGAPRWESTEIFCPIHREWENFGICTERYRWMLETSYMATDMFTWIVDEKSFPAPHEFLMRWDDPTSSTYRYTWEVGK